MKVRKVYLSIIWLVFLSSFCAAQKVISLEECVQKAKNASLTVKKMQLIEQSIKVNLQQSKKLRYPTLNFSGTGGYNFGRTVDPSSNSFANTTIGFNQYSLSTGVTLYNGGKIKKNIEKAEIDNQVALENTNQIINDISLAVANLYLQILFAEENLAIYKVNLTQTDLQKQRLQKMVDVGTKPKGDLLNFDYQLAQNLQQIVSTENTIKSLYLDLKQYMDMPLTDEIIIAHPEIGDIGATADLIEKESVYEMAVNNQPSINASELKVKSAEKNIDIAKADLLPSLNLFGSVSSNYSTLGKEITGFSTVPFPQNVLINNVPAQIISEQQVPTIQDSKFFDQLNNNLGQSIGLRINVPIYNQGSIKASIQRSEINLETARLEDKENKDKLRKDINKVLLDIENAKREYTSSKLGLATSKLLLENTLKKYELGALSTVDLEDIKSKNQSAQTQLLMAKYKYLFNVAILDFYLGRPLKIGQ